MDLRFLSKIQSLLLRKKGQKEYFLCLLFKPSKIGAILFEEVSGNLHIVNRHEKNIARNISSISEEDLIEASDEVISFIENSIPQELSVAKTIFGLPYDAVVDGKIKKEILLKFKKLCDSLSLIPMGFIVDIEAIIYFLQKKDGIPITSIFIELTKHNVYVYLVRGGNIVEVKSSEVFDSYLKTVEKLLSDVQDFEILPSKLILLNYDGIESIQQEFLSYPWKKELPFLHVPQVITLEKGFEDEALINGVGNQMGFDVLLDDRKDAADSVQQDKSSEEVDVDFESDFGFVKEKDIVQKEVKENIFKNQEKPEEDKIEEVNEEEQHEDSLHKEFDKKNSFSNLSSKVLKLIPKFASFINIFSFVKFPQVPGITFSIKGFIIILVPLIASVVLILFLYYNFVLKAEIILFAEKKILDKKQSILFTKDENLNTEKSIIPLSLKEEIEEGSSEKQTSGTKDTGDKAKGKVTIFSRLTQSKTFPEKTKLQGPNGLELTMDKSVTLASSSADASADPSKTTVDVTAVEIGKESNLPSGAKFTINPYDSSDIVAKNESAFSGGTKRTISVVSQKDIDELTNSLLKDLQEKALAGLRSNLKGEEEIIQETLTWEFINRQYDKKVNEEAKKITLSAKVKFNVGSYSKKDIVGMISFLSQKEIPDSFSHQANMMQYKVSDILINKDRTVSANLVIKAEYLPNINVDEIKKSSAGTFLNKTEEKLKQLPNISDRKILLKQNIFPFLPNFLPFNPNNILVTVKKDA